MARDQVAPKVAPATRALRKFLTLHGLSVRQWAIRTGFDYRSAKRLVAGDRVFVSATTAARVERATGGAVVASLWGQLAPTRRKKR
jgi:hypothetical protein